MQRTGKPAGGSALRSRALEARRPPAMLRALVLFIVLPVCASSVAARSQITPVLTPTRHPDVQGQSLQAITHVTVVDPRSGAGERPDMTILFRDSTIVAVEKYAEAHGDSR